VGIVKDQFIILNIVILMNIAHVLKLLVVVNVLIVIISLNLKIDFTQMEELYSLLEISG
jgi:hypothetical protein